MSLDSAMQSIWYSNSRVAWLLLPLSWLFGAVSVIRRFLYQSGWLATIRVTKPVIVIGNITVGGTGKTPLVIWLAQALTTRGYKVAVIARGYRGAADSWPQAVTMDSDPDVVGDEPVVIAQQVDAIVVAGPDRVADAKTAIELGADIVISDDGLQHYRLHRDLEIAVVDGSRMFGNGLLLPAGPLREAPSRLQRADLVFVNQRNATTNIDSSFNTGLKYRVELIELRSLKSDHVLKLDSLRGQQVHVVTGIGHPQAFVDALRAHGIKVLPRLFPDHALIKQEDIEFGDALPVLMTTKDAVKCRKLDIDERYWVVDAHAVLDATASSIVIDLIQAIINDAN